MSSMPRTTLRFRFLFAVVLAVFVAYLATPSASSPSTRGSKRRSRDGNSDAGSQSSTRHRRTSSTRGLSVEMPAKARRPNGYRQLCRILMCLSSVLVAFHEVFSDRCGEQLFVREEDALPTLKRLSWHRTRLLPPVRSFDTDRKVLVQIGKFWYRSRKND